jgi:hypothetical protein
MLDVRQIELLSRLPCSRQTIIGVSWYWDENIAQKVWLCSQLPPVIAVRRALTCLRVSETEPSVFNFTWIQSHHCLVPVDFIEPRVSVSSRICSSSNNDIHPVATSTSSAGSHCIVLVALLNIRQGLGRFQSDLLTLVQAHAFITCV